MPIALKATPSSIGCHATSRPCFAAIASIFVEAMYA
jgi:hypothetical protein